MEEKVISLELKQLKNIDLEIVLRWINNVGYSYEESGSKLDGIINRGECLDVAYSEYEQARQHHSLTDVEPDTSCGLTGR